MKKYKHNMMERYGFDKPKFKRLLPLLSLTILYILLNPIHAETEVLNKIQTSEIAVLFGKSIENIAEDVKNLYPDVKMDLIKKLKWEIEFRPDVVLIKDRDVFVKAAGNDLIVAFAVPERNLIVLDTSRVYEKPFTIEATLKHELCHLVLHHNIERDKLPRWMDEGVCQWASGGIAEIMTKNGNKELTKAVISDRLIDIKNLLSFPKDDKSLILSYEESKSFVEYIVNQYGEQGILNVLGHMKKGHSADYSIEKSLLVNASEIEKKWRADLKKKNTWFSYFSNNLYIILFSFAALITVYGFIRLLKKKRAYVDDVDGEDKEV
ncbi:MAG: hypothetical protein A2Y97_08960 [Nitrospirae bacterium RBG_13_39_12]|nr:MAG: hypothetical protein A2Y97_08960 [Nitrospirae bacterium RBG_13_39_12]